MRSPSLRFRPRLFLFLLQDNDGSRVVTVGGTPITLTLAASAERITVGTVVASTASTVAGAAVFSAVRITYLPADRDRFLSITNTGGIAGKGYVLRASATVNGATVTVDSEPFNVGAAVVFLDFPAAVVRDEIFPIQPRVRNFPFLWFCFACFVVF